MLAARRCSRGFIVRKDKVRFRRCSKCTAALGLLAIGSTMFRSPNISRRAVSWCYRVLSIDFRMPPAARYPDTLADVNFGICYLKANAERFATRPELVGGLGTSSGGHLLLLNVLRPRDPRYTSHPLPAADASLAFAVACWPVADPLARYHAVQERRNDRLVEAHHQFWPSEEAMAEGSPQLILERGEDVETPPALIMQGTADDNLTPDMAADFAAAYTKAGGSIALHKFEGQPHAFIPRDPAAPDAQRALGLITDFIHHQTR